MKEVLLEPADHRLGVIRTAGDVVHEVGDAIAWVVVESGDGHLTIDAQSADVGGRAGVFDGPGWSAVAPRGTTITTDGTVTPRRTGAAAPTTGGCAPTSPRDR